MELAEDAHNAPPSFDILQKRLPAPELPTFGQNIRFIHTRAIYNKLSIA